MRQRDAPKTGELLLLTAHHAEGLKFDHVVALAHGWHRVGRGEDTDASRRLYYVAMTWVKLTLTLTRLPGTNPSLDALRDTLAVARYDPLVEFPATPPEALRRHRRLSLRDLILGYAG